MRKKTNGAESATTDSKQMTDQQNAIKSEAVEAQDQELEIIGTSDMPEQSEAETNDQPKAGIVIFNKVELVKYVINASIKFGDLKIKSSEWEDFESYVENSFESLRFMPGLFSDFWLSRRQSYEYQDGKVGASTFIEFLVTKEEAALLTDAFVLKLIKKKLWGCDFSVSSLDKVRNKKGLKWSKSLVPTDFCLELEDKSPLYDPTFVRFAIDQRYHDWKAHWELNKAITSLSILRYGAQHKIERERMCEWVCERLDEVIPILESLDHPDIEN